MVEKDTICSQIKNACPAIKAMSPAGHGQEQAASSPFGNHLLLNLIGTGKNNLRNIKYIPPFFSYALILNIISCYLNVQYLITFDPKISEENNIGKIYQLRIG